MTFLRTSIVMLLMSCVCSSVAVGDTPESHATKLRSRSHHVITEAVNGGLHLPVTAVSLSIPPSPLNDLVQQSVVQELLGRTGNVFVDAADADTVLTYSAIEAAVSYGAPFTKTFFGSKFIVRSVAIDVEMTLSTRISNAVIFSSVVRSTAVDTVQFLDLRVLDESAPPFITIAPVAYTFFDSIIEPAVVTIASAVAIYLFFTIRS